MLRFFAKRELIQKDCPKEDEVLCPYQLKILLLWTCEEMAPEWWNSASIISICRELLKTLSEWLKKRHCSNYFIPEANLFQGQANSDILEKTVSQLDKFSKSEILSNWFVEHYILIFIRSYFVPKERMPHFVNYVLPLFDSWKANKLKSIEFFFFKTFAFSHLSCRTIMNHQLNSGLFHSLMTQNVCRSHETTDRRLLNNLEMKINWRLINFPTMQNTSCFTHQDNLLCILYIAYGLGCGEISWDGILFVEFLNAISMHPKIVRSQYHNFPTPWTAHRSRFQFLCSQNLMKNLTGLNSRSEFQLLSLVTKQFLMKALIYD